jgi:hypothetical protein
MTGLRHYIDKRGICVFFVLELFECAEFHQYRRHQLTFLSGQPTFETIQLYWNRVSAVIAFSAACEARVRARRFIWSVAALSCDSKPFVATASSGILSGAPFGFLRATIPRSETASALLIARFRPLKIFSNWQRSRFGNDADVIGVVSIWGNDLARPLFT